MLVCLWIGDQVHLTTSMAWCLSSPNGTKWSTLPLLVRIHCWLACLIGHSSVHQRLRVDTRSKMTFSNALRYLGRSQDKLQHRYDAVDSESMGDNEEASKCLSTGEKCHSNIRGPNQKLHRITFFLSGLAAGILLSMLSRAVSSSLQAASRKPSPIPDCELFPSPVGPLDLELGAYWFIRLSWHTHARHTRQLLIRAACLSCVRCRMGLSASVGTWTDQDWRAAEIQSSGQCIRRQHRLWHYMDSWISLPGKFIVHQFKHKSINWPAITTQKKIRDRFWELVRGESDFVGEDLDPKAAHELHHTMHCIEYLRQMIQCHADMTVEYATSEPDDPWNPYHISGYGIPHQCMNWDAMYPWIAERIPDWASLNKTKDQPLPKRSWKQKKEKLKFFDENKHSIPLSPESKSETSSASAAAHRSLPLSWLHLPFLTRSTVSPLRTEKYFIPIHSFS